MNSQYYNSVENEKQKDTSPFSTNTVKPGLLRNNPFLQKINDECSSIKFKEEIQNKESLKEISKKKIISKETLKITEGEAKILGIKKDSLTKDKSLINCDNQSTNYTSNSNETAINTTNLKKTIVKLENIANNPNLESNAMNKLKNKSTKIIQENDNKQEINKTHFNPKSSIMIIKNDIKQEINKSPIITTGTLTQQLKNFETPQSKIQRGENDAKKASIFKISTINNYNTQRENRNDFKSKLELQMSTKNENKFANGPFRMPGIEKKPSVFKSNSQPNRIIPDEIEEIIINKQLMPKKVHKKTFTKF